MAPWRLGVYGALWQSEQAIAVNEQPFEKGTKFHN
jgi:hypothetical protein